MSGTAHRRSCFAAAAALLLCTTVAASAAASGESTGYVDIVLAEGDGRCAVERVQVDAAPPATVAIDSDRIDFDCSGSTRFDFAADTAFAFAFDDEAGTATAAKVRIAATKFGVTCTYEAAKVTLERDGASRSYGGGPVGAKKVKGSFLCPGSVNLDRAEVVFHQ